MEYPKKLIEVALPLDDINAAASREKSIRHGHPSTLHLWWARRPLAAARAVLFAQLVNDPGGKRGYGAYKGQTKEDAQKERERLFQIIRDFVKWENTNNEEVLQRAREEIRKSWRETCEITGEDPEKMPPFLDPFAGGGAIPLEAQRLGLEAHASDLNPVAVMINKAMIEIPPKFAGRKPVGPSPPGHQQKRLPGEGNWDGAKGLAEDVRRYGAWIRKEVEKQIGKLFPKATVPDEYGGGKASVIAWLWTRTVKCPNPACGCEMPLAKSFELSSQKGKKAWVEAIINKQVYPPDVKFVVRTGKASEEQKKAIKLGCGFLNDSGKKVQATFRCLCCGAPATGDYINEEANSSRMGKKILALVLENKSARVFCSPLEEELRATQEMTQNLKSILGIDESLISQNCVGTGGINTIGRRYGFFKFRDYYSDRQLISMKQFSDIISVAREKIIQDAVNNGWRDDGEPLEQGGYLATAYGDAVATYLAFAVDKISDLCSTLVSWTPQRNTLRSAFARQAISMTWEFAESNPFSSSTGNFLGALDWISRALEKFPAQNSAIVKQNNAISNVIIDNAVISTDPPYYDNIGYADLSDYFYVWLRRSLHKIYPNLFSTLLVPKKDELVASNIRHNGKEKAEQFFLDSMTIAIQKMATSCHAHFPTTIYYAFKQSDTKNSTTASTGWEVFLEAVIKAGFMITGTWPIRTERSTRSVSIGANALASSVLLVCRKLTQDSSSISRKQFNRELEETLPEALEDMIGGKEGSSPIAPVDLAQAAIGPGMAVFSKYSAILKADGSAMNVHTALILINKVIDEYFTHAESNMGSDTRFCVDWFQQYGFKAGPFGEADVLARAKGTSVEGADIAGVVESGAGKVRLLRLTEYPKVWDPEKDKRVPIWEACHHLCRTLEESEVVAGTLLARMSEKAEPIRQLAYRLYTLCERKGWAEEARIYNGLITSWRAIFEASHEIGKKGEQLTLDM